jgi:hypothetical protein
MTLYRNISVDDARKALCRNASRVMPAVRKYIKNLVEASEGMVSEEEFKRSAMVKHYIEAFIGPCEEIG